MAITINSVPATYPSMHDDLWFVASSTNVGTTNFKFVYDVYIDGTQVSRNKIFPSPSAEGNYGVFNASPMVRAYATNYFEPSGTSVLVASNNKIKVDYQVRIGEEVGGAITANLASGSYSGYNYYSPLFSDIFSENGDIPLVLSNYYDNLLIENYTDDWLSDRDNSDITIEYGDQFFITFLKITSGTYKLWVETINESNVVGTSVSGNITMAGEFNLFNFQAGSINEWAGTTLINENTYGYNVYITRGAAVTRILRFRQVCNPKYRQYNLHFLNRLGGYDTMAFRLMNKRRSEFQRSNYRRNPYVLSGGEMTNIDSYNKYNETTFNFAIQHKDLYMLTSDWVNDQDFQWLAQLVASPIIYMEVQGAFFPVTINNNNYQYKYSISDGLFNFDIEVEVGKYTNSQFR
mgnify:CR=1 FL=1|jgi:hypothetical protein